MNSSSPPLIREKLRVETEIVAAVAQQLERIGFAPISDDPLKDALVQIFGRYCEILSDRLNRVPESHRRDFLNMLGASPAPAIPARVPLSFKAVESAKSFTIVVPKFTQVAAPAESGFETTIFETVKDLPLVQATLTYAVAVDTRRLVHADVGSMVSETSPTGFTKPFLLADAIPLARALHISQPDIIGLPKLTRLQLKIELDPTVELASDDQIDWGIQSDTGFIMLKPESDTTRGLKRSGELTFEPPKEWPGRTILAQTRRWLTCRPHSDMRFLEESKRYPALITKVEISGYSSITAVPPTQAFHGGAPLDVSRDFFPFGERPRFGEVFYILSEIFSSGGARIIIDIKLTNPADAVDSPIPVVSRKGNPRLQWEAHAERGWVALSCTDGTFSLTQDGKIEFDNPSNIASTTLNGMDGYWVRARLVGGHYAVDGIPSSPQNFAMMSPPSIAAIQLSSGKAFGPIEPDLLIRESNLEYHKIDLSQPFNPFPVPEEQGLILYLGFSAVRGALALSGRTVSLFAAPCNKDKRVFCRGNDNELERIAHWQAHTSSGWQECIVSDTTRGLRSSGIAELKMPDNLSNWGNCALDIKEPVFWVRVVWNAQDADEPPRPRRLLLNTVLASQTMRLGNELLGSSNGRPKQIFYTLSNPIIGKATLEVRELNGNEPREKDVYHKRNGPDSKHLPNLNSEKSIPSLKQDAWNTWCEVEDFSASDSHSSHYTLNRLTGCVQFGDGKNGRIPPVGANNVRLHEYHTGGGQEGNRSIGKITQLRTTIPYVESVTNHEPAGGGQDKETPDMLARGATARIRHRDRAICTDDYVDLANKASPEVAYASCVGARDLTRDQKIDSETNAGIVSVIVVPYSSELRPQPSFELLKNVKAFLDDRRPVGIDLIVLGPEYVSISVVADIVWEKEYSITGAVAECEKRLNGFLHPVTGAPDGRGWRFGRMPHASDIYPVLGAIDGLDHIKMLELRSEEDRPGLLASSNFLICSGKHEIRVC